MVRFYTSKKYGSLYKGFLKLSRKNLSEFKSWIKSGHILKVGDRIVKTTKNIELEIIFKEMDEIGV